MISPSSEILKGCLDNNRKAQLLLFKHCYSFLYGIGRRYRINDDEVKSLVNTCFLKVLNNLEKYNPEIPFGAWIRRIMVNTAIDDFRKSKKRLSLFENVDFSDSVLMTEHEWNQADLDLDAEYLFDMVNRLPNMANKVFNLFAIDGFSHKEIGGTLSISEGTSKWHLNDARKRLSVMIKERINSKKSFSHEKQAR